MKKRIKLTNDNYLDSSSIIHDKTLLSDILNSINAKVVYDNLQGELDLSLDDYGYGIYLIITVDGSTIYAYRSNSNVNKNSVGTYTINNSRYGTITCHPMYPYLISSRDSEGNYPKIITIIKLTNFDNDSQ